MLVCFNENSALSWPDGSKVAQAEQPRFLKKMQREIEATGIRILASETGENQPVVMHIDVSQANRAALFGFLQAWPICAVTVQPPDIPTIWDHHVDAGAVLVARELQNGNVALAQRLNMLSPDELYDEITQAALDLMCGHGLAPNPGIEEFDRYQQEQFVNDLRNSGVAVPEEVSLDPPPSEYQKAQEQRQDRAYAEWRGARVRTPFDTPEES